jgi:nitroreductase
VTQGTRVEALGLAPETLLAVLETAALAPSLHNSQPWRFHVAGGAVELHADPERRLAVADPDGREQRIGCGAALFTLRLALVGRGVRPLVSLLPDRTRPEVLAVVRAGGRVRATPVQRDLLAAVPRRRTHRRAFDGGVVESGARHDLVRAALEEGAWLEVVDDERRAVLGDLARAAHRHQQADAAFQAELAAWTGHTDDRSDGVPAHLGGPAPAPSEGWVLRDFSGGHAAPGPPENTRPLIAVLSVHAEGAREDVRAGEALQHVLLAATVRGLSVSFLSQLVEVPEVREQVRKLLARGTGATRPPVAVLRIGHGTPLPATPRLPIHL